MATLLINFLLLDYHHSFYFVIFFFRTKAQCHCNDGYGGKDCSQEDVNECKYRPCSLHADCTNTLGSFQCSCRKGFQGDGFKCTPSMEVNEVVPSPDENDDENLQQETKEAILDRVKEMIDSKNGTFNDPNIGKDTITEGAYTNHVDRGLVKCPLY